MVPSMKAPLWSDRSEAGEALAQALRKHLSRPSGFVLALPRGGLPVAAPVARLFGWPLWTWCVRKLTTPFNPEFALGATGPLGVVIWNEPALRLSGLDAEDRQSCLERAREELCRRINEYGDPPAIRLQGQCVIIVDDGVATGFTARAAVASVRLAGAGRIVLAVPVVDQQLARELETEVDDLVALARVEGLEAVCLWYEDFSQLTDADVHRFLSVSRKSTREI